MPLHSTCTQNDSILLQRTMCIYHNIISGNNIKVVTYIFSEVGTGAGKAYWWPCSIICMHAIASYSMGVTRLLQPGDNTSLN